MKKIIAISVMFALVAGAAFADTSFGGGFNTHFNLAQDKGEGDDALAGSYGAGGNVDVNWSGENAGGQVRFYNTNTFFDHAIGWWKPIDQLKIQLGGWDGDWGHNQIVGWGFTAGAKDTVAFGYAFNCADQNQGFWGGFNKGLGISIYPADGFEINIGIPLYGDEAYTAPAGVIYTNTKVNVKADIPDIGSVKLALDMNKADKDADQLTNIFFAFYLGAIENMGVELGAAVTSSGGEKKNDVIDLGVGYSLNADDFGLKVGIGVGIAGKKYVEIDGEKVPTDDKETMPFYIHFLPSYNLGSLKAYFNFGVSTLLSAPEGTSAGDCMRMWFNPYVEVPISGGSFWAGIKFKQEPGYGGDKPDATWSIPIGFSFGF